MLVFVALPLLDAFILCAGADIFSYGCSAVQSLRLAVGSLERAAGLGLTGFVQSSFYLSSFTSSSACGHSIRCKRIHPVAVVLPCLGFGVLRRDLLDDWDAAGLQSAV